MLLPGHGEATPGVLLGPEEVEKWERNLQSGELALNGNLWVNLISMGVP